MKLTVISGCMFSGKSSELIRRLIRAQIAKKEVLLIRPEIDSRTDLNESKTRLGITFPSVPAVSFNGKTNPILDAVVDRVARIERWPDVVGIDEAQFFGPELTSAVKSLLSGYGIEVIVAGLNTDFLGRPFGEMPTLMALADEVVTVTAICTVCGNEATRTQRLINGEPAPVDSPLVVVGDSERYEARCRQHHEV